ncbi:DUF3108 domain-containing protein [Formosa sp. S-31]|uniref:DUF3108 domain-containing protein n=1 Tax=Formosa sp. S-31 TaxID=2790949 RepID=UPI003EBEB346
MRNPLIIFLFVFGLGIQGRSQNESVFQEGEWFKFEMSYSGFLKAGEATLEVKKDYFKGKPVYHVVGKGWTTGPIKWFFKVEDLYETYIDMANYVPYKFIRKIDEGGHTKNIEIEFDHVKNKALVYNVKHDKHKEFSTSEDVQDMVSTFYYLRNELNVDGLQVGEEVFVNMFFDEENYPFKLKYLGTEIIETKFGDIPALKFRPYVMAGRVFKEEESLTLWVTNDKNKMPLRVKADLAVGSLRADLDAFKGLKYPLKIIAKP